MCNINYNMTSFASILSTSSGVFLGCGSFSSSALPPETTIIINFVLIILLYSVMFFFSPNHLFWVVISECDINGLPLFVCFFLWFACFTRWMRSIHFLYSIPFSDSTHVYSLLSWHCFQWMNNIMNSDPVNILAVSSGTYVGEFLQETQVVWGGCTAGDGQVSTDQGTSKHFPKWWYQPRLPSRGHTSFLLNARYWPTFSVCL